MTKLNDLVSEYKKLRIKLMDMKLDGANSDSIEKVAHKLSILTARISEQQKMKTNFKIK